MATPMTTGHKHKEEPMEKVIDETTVDVTDKGKAAAAEGDKTPAGDKKDAGADTKPAGSGKTPAQIEGILEKYGLDSADALEDFIGGLTTLKEKIGANDVEELLQNRNELKKIQAEMARAEEAKRRETETPEETIQRLETQLIQQQELRRQDELRKQQAAEDAKLIASFNGYVSKSVDSLGGYSKAENKFLKKYLGVNNPIHDIELTDSAGIKKLITTAAKDFDALKKAIIEDFQKNGSKEAGGRSVDNLPPIPKMDRAGEPGTDGGETKIKNMRDARVVAKKQLLERLMRR
jgi:hypothetical protein